MRKFPQLHAPITGIVVDESACETDDLAFCGGVQVTVPATESWDALVARAVASDWRGIEALSGLNGTVADAVRDNFMAHGQGVGDVLYSVRTWDRSADAQKTFPMSDLGLISGGSRLQEKLTDGSLRFEILDVAFLFRQGDLTTPIHDDALAALVGLSEGGRAKLTAVRDAVLSLG